MYSQEDYLAVGRQLRKRRLVCALPLVLLLAAIVLSFLQRIEWLSAALLALLAVSALFCHQLFILPVKRYQAFLQLALHGRNRKDMVRFDNISLQAVVREGLRCYPATMRADSQNEELDERTYYWDANLPFPDWQQGQEICLMSHEKLITGWETP